MTQIGETFRALHVKGTPFILGNVWDAGSAKMMARMGARALATSSAAHAFTLGRPDGGTVTRDEALAHAQDICAATTLPVQGDFENGFGDDPDVCALTVKLSAETGLAGICIEDIQFPAGTAYDFDLAVERMKAAASAARAVGRTGSWSGPMIPTRRSAACKHLTRLVLIAFMRRCRRRWRMLRAFVQQPTSL